MSNSIPNPTDEEISAALDDFLEEHIPSGVPVCTHIHDDMISVHHGSSLESGKDMLILEFTAQHPDSDGEYAKMTFGLDEDATVALLFALHAQGTEIWGEEVDDDDTYLG